MQRPGTPAGTRPLGPAARHTETAGRRTFQIKAFSTELKNHVMVMDFVKSNWFPSQRRAKVCILRLYRGLKPAERSASSYEETLTSQNTKMISSLVISQLLDENKPTEKGAAVPALCADAQPPTWPGKRALARRSGVTINRAFAFLPGQLGPQPPAGVQGPEPALTPKEEKQPGGSPQKGFASITITARRVGPPARALVWGTGGDPLCSRCRAQDPQLRGRPALASGADPGRHHGPLACTEPSRSSPVMRLGFPEAHARLCDGHQYWVASVDRGEDRFSPGRPRSGQGPLLFSSCVHLRVSRRCPNATCSPDGSPSVPVEPTQPAGPQTHRAVLSLNLNCSSHRLTPDGADGPATGGPISSSLKPQLAEGSGLQGPRWAPALHPSLGQVHLGAGTCPWSGPPPTESTELADAGTRQITARKGKGDHGTPRHTSGHTSTHANQLSIHIPGWSYRAGDVTCCDLVLQLKECQTREAAAIPGPAPAPTPPEPAPAEEPETPDLREGCSECQQPPASPSLTLQEALEARRPQFISRSQERLRKLELMAQQRRAQRQDSPGPKPGPLPVRASRRQFTVPHPLSDNLFKPKERCISEKEMHMRSKRIYNNLPEVRKKKEEQKKRVILQSNRLRAEVFKKQLLDQLLQRNAV
ncbi:(E2-independent) E3 ubiquitin-conjugating enzyme FATS isoform X1 [Myotis daubentonii]|uniref:(E2-independent) E3 ubiquitin-conjugating enzyme FATS isoform X1 n=1 Tax=Myotis daubentonii TaxID=98922 RepID=UPI0028732E8D|nr:(E2-independent) E3 ubiquitin-conjugating enzyme FATS isoform X1 [Myotis daubentonii]